MFTNPLRCHRNPDHNNFPLYLIQFCGGNLSKSWFMATISTNLGGIDPEKLYRAILTS